MGGGGQLYIIRMRDDTSNLYMYHCMVTLIVCFMTIYIFYHNNVIHMNHKATVNYKDVISADLKNWVNISKLSNHLMVGHIKLLSNLV